MKPTIVAGLLALATIAGADVRFGLVWIAPAFVDEWQTIELKNYGGTDRELTGWSLQTVVHGGDPVVWFFPQGSFLYAGGTLTVVWNRAGQDSNGRFFTGEGLGAIDRRAGSLALLSPDGIEHYVQWGAAGQPLEAEAAEAGQWIIGEFLGSLPEPGRNEGGGFSSTFDRDSGQYVWYTGFAIYDVVSPRTWGTVKINTP